MPTGSGNYKWETCSTFCGKLVPFGPGKHSTRAIPQGGQDRNPKEADGEENVLSIRYYLLRYRWISEVDILVQKCFNPKTRKTGIPDSNNWAFTPYHTLVVWDEYSPPPSLDTYMFLAGDIQFLPHQQFNQIFVGEIDKLLWLGHLHEMLVNVLVGCLHQTCADKLFCKPTDSKYIEGVKPGNNIQKCIEKIFFPNRSCRFILSL